MARMSKYTERVDGNLELLQLPSAFTNRSIDWRDANGLRSLKKGKPRKAIIISDDESGEEKPRKPKRKLFKRLKDEINIKTENETALDLSLNQFHPPQQAAAGNRRKRDDDEDITGGRATKKQRTWIDHEDVTGGRSTKKKRTPPQTRGKNRYLPTLNIDERTGFGSLDFGVDHIDERGQNTQASSFVQPGQQAMNFVPRVEDQDSTFMANGFPTDANGMIDFGNGLFPPLANQNNLHQRWPLPNGYGYPSSSTAYSAMPLPLGYHSLHQNGHPANKNIYYHGGNARTAVPNPTINPNIYRNSLQTNGNFNLPQGTAYDTMPAPPMNLNSLRQTPQMNGTTYPRQGAGYETFTNGYNMPPRTYPSPPPNTPAAEPYFNSRTNTAREHEANIYSDFPSPPIFQTLETPDMLGADESTFRLQDEEQGEELLLPWEQIFQENQQSQMAPDDTTNQQQAPLTGINGGSHTFEMTEQLQFQYNGTNGASHAALTTQQQQVPLTDDNGDSYDAAAPTEPLQFPFNDLNAHGHAITMTEQQQLPLTDNNGDSNAAAATEPLQFPFNDLNGHSHATTMAEQLHADFMSMIGENHPTMAEHETPLTAMNGENNGATVPEKRQAPSAGMNENIDAPTTTELQQAPTGINGATQTPATTEESLPDLRLYQPLNEEDIREIQAALAPSIQQLQDEYPHAEIPIVAGLSYNAGLRELNNRKFELDEKSGKASLSLISRNKWVKDLGNWKYFPAIQWL